MESILDEKKQAALKHFVTDLEKDVFVLKNLPEVIKGALFSRYSRSTLGLKELLLKDFILNDETAFEQIVQPGQSNNQDKDDSQSLAIQKAQKFYDRILDGYGDDSIGELGGAHLACENVSMLCAKVIEDARIGGSPLEKSTRYIYFDQKVNGDFLFCKEPTLMQSEFKELYLSTCRSLFETYKSMIEPLSTLFQTQYPKEESVSDGAYRAAIRAKVCDCLRGLLPASTLTNMGVFGNGRFFESLLQKMHANPLKEIQRVSQEAQEELEKVIPSFVRRAKTDHKHYASFKEFMIDMTKQIEHVSKEISSDEKGEEGAFVRLNAFDPKAFKKVAAALLFPHSELSMEALLEQVEAMDDEKIDQILEKASAFRKNRRHKSPRALENALFTFEICADFGSYRDLQRHRMLTQEKKRLNCKHGFWIPEEIQNTSLEKEYVEAMQMAKGAFETIEKKFPQEAQYVVPMGYNIHWYFTINLRALQWLCELRSQAQGHITYRNVAQEMAKQVCDQVPQFKRFFDFVDYEGHDLGRLNQEIRIHDKKNKEKQKDNEN